MTRGIIDLIKMKAEIYTNDLGTDILKKIFQLNTLTKLKNIVKIAEAVVETDEELMMKYLEGEEIN